MTAQLKDREYEPFYWLTEDSQTFLERGYLREGQDAYSRLSSILT